MDGAARVLAVAAWQAGMMRGPGLWALARRRPCGGRDLLCAGAATRCAALEAPRATGWRRALEGGADEFLFVPGRPESLLRRSLTEKGAAARRAA